MKHQNIDELGAVAEIVPFEIARKLSRRERLERWADLLDENPGKLNALTRIEYLTRGERPEARADNSPLEVAFKDPVLRRRRTCRRPARRRHGVLRAVGPPCAPAVLRLPLFRQHDRSRPGGAAAPACPRRHPRLVCLNSDAPPALLRPAARSNLRLVAESLFLLGDVPDAALAVARDVAGRLVVDDRCKAGGRHRPTSWCRRCGRRRSIRPRPWRRQRRRAAARRWRICRSNWSCRLRPCRTCRASCPSRRSRSCRPSCPSPLPVRRRRRSTAVASKCGKSDDR